MISYTRLFSCAVWLIVFVLINVPTVAAGWTFNHHSNEPTTSNEAQAAAFKNKHQIKGNSTSGPVSVQLTPANKPWVFYHVRKCAGYVVRP